jgi:hypothetical protein
MDIVPLEIIHYKASVHHNIIDYDIPRNAFFLSIDNTT